MGEASMAGQRGETTTIYSAMVVAEESIAMVEDWIAAAAHKWCHGKEKTRRAICRAMGSIVPGVCPAVGAKCYALVGEVENMLLSICHCIYLVLTMRNEKIDPCKDSKNEPTPNL